MYGIITPFKSLIPRVKSDVEMISPDLLDILACPACKGGLLQLADGSRKLLCLPCGLAFPIRGGIPVMLVAEAEKITGQGIEDTAR
jgi:uncharacterized protein YbaR (Trm112 family)